MNSKIDLYAFEKAPENSLFVKKGDKLVAVSFSELAKDLKSEVQKVGVLDHEIKVVGQTLAMFKKNAKKHFIIVFTLFELKALKGEIVVEDENLLDLDTKVISGELSVEEAINKHEFLKATFEALYGEEYDKLQELAK